MDQDGQADMVTSRPEPRVLVYMLLGSLNGQAGFSTLPWSHILSRGQTHRGCEVPSLGRSSHRAATGPGPQDRKPGSDSALPSDTGSSLPPTLPCANYKEVGI